VIVSGRERDEGKERLERHKTSWLYKNRSGEKPLKMFKPGGRE